MLQAFRDRLEDEDGFTLIELLVVVIIIGILAAIAIPVFLNQRQSGWYAAAESDSRNIAIDVETAATRNNGVYPDAAGYAALNVQNSADVTTVYTQRNAGQAFCLAVTHAQLTAAGVGAPQVYYDSLQGGVESDPAAADFGC